MGTGVEVGQRQLGCHSMTLGHSSKDHQELGKALHTFLESTVQQIWSFREHSVWTSITTDKPSLWYSL